MPSPCTTNLGSIVKQEQTSFLTCKLAWSINSSFFFFANKNCFVHAIICLIEQMISSYV